MKSIGYWTAVWATTMAALVTASAAQAENRAGVVILNSTGELITRCVTFEEDALSLEQLLDRSGFAWVGDSESDIDPICFLYNDGAMDCSPHADGYVWSVFIQDVDGWTPIGNSLSNELIEHGAITGFAYGPAGEAIPPETTFAEVCDIVSRAGLVFDFSDGSRVFETIEFFGETLNGLQLLRKSSLELITQSFSFGVGICSIGGEGQPADDCFGDPDFRFWGLNRLTHTDEWISSPIGVGEVVVYDGDVLGFFYAQWGEEQPPIRHADVFEAPSHVSHWHLYAR